MGAKFRETPKLNKHFLMKTFEESIDKVIKGLICKTHLPLHAFDPWRSTLLKLLRTETQKHKHEFDHYNSVLKDNAVVHYIQKLHKRFVIIPIDKAANNFAFVCKKFYIDVLRKELGITVQGAAVGNNVYQPVRFSMNYIFGEHSKFLAEYNISLDEANKHIPFLYWTSKQHKTPYKSRFIAGACKCTTKQISIEVALALKCIKTQFKNYCNVIKKRTGLSYYWSIDNSSEFMDKIMHVKKAESIETFDFSTLYTNLPLNDIFDALQSLIIKMYKNSGSTAILVNSNVKKAFWSRGNFPKKYKIYTIDKLIEALKFILFNTYVQFGGHVFKQILGIPMGGNASPFIADLYLSWNEYQFMDKLSKANFDLARDFVYNSRYLDDIAIVNYSDFGKISKDIYHKTLLLEASNSSDLSDTFLDLYIRVINQKFLIGIYHKVDDFKFEVISFPFPESNIHSSMGYNTFYSQLIRFFRLCNNKVDFLARVQLTYKKLHKRGYGHYKLLKTFRKFCHAYTACLKYGETDCTVLWEECLSYSSQIYCKFDDHVRVGDITRPCSVVLTDIYHDHKKSHNLKSCSIVLSDCIDVPKCQDTNHVSLYQIPLGLTNPSNHCYLNSVLQIILHILKTNVWDKFNDNIEGDILRKIILISTLSKLSRSEIMEVKGRLRMYDILLSGSHQQDACECLMTFMDIIHKGTKYSLLPNAVHDEDDSAVSLTNSMFMSTYQKVFTCSMCGDTVSRLWQSRMLNIFPTENCSMEKIIQNNLSQQVQKRCTACKRSTLHSEILKWISPPKYLILALNRFTYVGVGTIKNNIVVPVQAQVSVDGNCLTLVGIIHHHGSSANSGHYTCTLFHNGKVFHCNDMMITESSGFEFVHSATPYIMVYSTT